MARDFDLLNRVWGPETATRILLERKGKVYEPRVLEAALRLGPRLLAEIEDGSVWETVLEAEPGPPMAVDEARIDDVLRAFAHFVDLKSPFLHGHSTGVAELAERAASASGAPEMDTTLLRRAGLVHDLGRVAVPSGIWNKEGPLSDGQWERVRLHPYSTERILVRCGPLKKLAEVASSHHERMDGSGYHRGNKAPSLSAATKLLATADMFRAMTEPRPHRGSLSPSHAADELNRAVREGKLDVLCARAVLEAAGETRKPDRSAWPEGLTDREVEVLRLLATGLSNKQIARRLTLSPKTVGHHVEHTYAKIGVSTRAGPRSSPWSRGWWGPLNSEDGALTDVANPLSPHPDHADMSEGNWIWRGSSFQVESPIEPGAVLEALTDFSEQRPELWPAIDPKVYRVHEVSISSALVTEGTAVMGGIRATELYEWDGSGTVRATIQESNLWHPGGTGELNATPRKGGGSILKVTRDRLPRTSRPACSRA